MLNPDLISATAPDADLPSVADVVVCSFHTPDDYYASAATRLRQSLDALGIAHHIVEVDKQPDEEWLEICRKKVPFLQSVCEANPDSKVFWIDVDCDVDYLPDFVRNFSADIIGFQRGFGHPLRIGYANNSRFWEPCFWGINTTAAARGFIADASAASATMTIRATDDYFFEEAWRKNADRLSFQVIPSNMLVGRADGAVAEARPFFSFGSSGNVATYQGIAQQHSRNKTGQTASGAPQVRSLTLRAARRVQSALPPRLAVPLRRLSDRAGLTDFLSPTPPAARQLSANSIYRIIHDAREGDADAVRTRIADVTSRRLMRGADKAVVNVAEAFLDYAAPVEGAQGDALRLLWWDKPYPGNYGDWLSPLIISSVSRRPIMFQRHDEIAAPPHLMSLGSIGRFAQASSILVGTGISRSDAGIDPGARFMSLRGPYTAAALREAGGPSVERFGDPAILLPRLFPTLRPASTNGRIALVRHFAHRNVALRLPEGVDEFSVLRSGREDILSLIRELHGYDAVLTSAMHVHITCQAYGLPVGLVTFEGFEDSVHGDGIKYRDYAAGVDLPERMPVSLGHDLRRRDLSNLIEQDRVGQAAMDSVHSALIDAIEAHDRALAEPRRRFAVAR